MSKTITEFNDIEALKALVADAKKSGYKFQGDKEFLNDTPIEQLDFHVLEGQGVIESPEKTTIRLFETNINANGQTYAVAVDDPFVVPFKSAIVIPSLEYLAMLSANVSQFKRFTEIVERIQKNNAKEEDFLFFAENYSAFRDNASDDLAAKLKKVMDKYNSVIEKRNSSDDLKVRSTSIMSGLPIGKKPRKTPQGVAKAMLNFQNVIGAKNAQVMQEQLTDLFNNAKDSGFAEALVVAQKEEVQTPYQDFLNQYPFASSIMVIDQQKNEQERVNVTFTDAGYVVTLNCYADTMDKDHNVCTKEHCFSNTEDVMRFIQAFTKLNSEHEKAFPRENAARGDAAHSLGIMHPNSSSATAAVAQGFQAGKCEEAKARCLIFY
ncbi:hypothetical protein MMH89_02965 [Candidatus Comchoanobacter bicostacola]|uniref:Uncharacterized protein n=1 Tax=Candidatus Comchoanobacter bicostacola TaxID=2919598 RepID=A0ABY5DHJ5_9GAMM|nr:hypothetical protein [Candidatus Comchoanobacter bicostacola]UTC24183.1 hypothetical protein MMH89_02965 [Candidatus Comchoanobacter bicostacola]